MADKIRVAADNSGPGIMHIQMDIGQYIFMVSVGMHYDNKMTYGGQCEMTGTREYITITSVHADIKEWACIDADCKPIINDFDPDRLEVLIAL